MAEYTYKDIIIDPTSEEAKNAVGKICYFSNSPRNILSDIYCNSAVEGILTNMEDGYFEVDNEGYWDCIILKKEEPKPEYVPFESIEEFVEAFNDHGPLADNFFDSVLYRSGMWLKSKNDIDLSQATVIKKYGICIDTMSVVVSWKNLLNDFEFLDGSPCGKEVKE